jgi:CheY-like chemotaxis protein
MALPRLLYIEDDPHAGEIVRRALSPTHEVIVETNGDAALARLRVERFDGIILDLQLPGRSGLELVPLLRAAAPESALPIIAVSARVLREEAARARAAGCVAFLEKPFALTRLRQAVRSALDGAEIPA